MCPGSRTNICSDSDSESDSTFCKSDVILSQASSSSEFCSFSVLEDDPEEPQVQLSSDLSSSEDSEDQQEENDTSAAEL